MIKLKDKEVESEDKCENCNSSAVHELKIGKTLIDLCDRCLNELKWQLS